MGVSSHCVQQYHVLASDVWNGRDRKYDQWVAGDKVSLFKK